MRIEVMHVDTDQGCKRISMKSTGQGAWVTVSAGCDNPLRIVQIRRVVWIANPEDIKKLI
jgi:hypothetical protein